MIMIISDGKSFSISSGLAHDKLISGIGGEISSSNRNVVARVTELLGKETAKVVVAHALHLNGALIANAERDESGAYTDAGNLQLTVGELFVKHIKDYDEGLTLGAGFNLGQALSKDKDNPFSNKYRLTFGGKDGEGYTKATIGKGSLKCVEDGVCQSDDVNQNLDNIQDLSYKYDVDTINIVFINPQDVKEKSEKAWGDLKSGQFVKDASKSFEEAVGMRVST